jgi:hypothetical protein
VKKSIGCSLLLTLLICAHNPLKSTDTWNPQATIIPGQPAQNGDSPQIAFDHNGNALAVWSQNDGSNYQIYYARYDGSTWSTTATVIPGQPAQFGYSPQIDFDHNGNALAVWSQYNGSDHQIYYARYDGSTWSTTATVIPGQPAQYGYSPQIDFDHNGNALAVWYQSDGSNNQIYYARYDGFTWSTTATIIPGQPAQDGYSPQIAFDHNGNALAVWSQYNGSNYKIDYARYDGATWSTPTIIPGQPAQFGYSPQIDFDNNGNALAVWVQNNSGKYQIYYAHYDDSTWSTPATVIPGQPAQNGNSPQIAFDHNGNALAVWSQYNGSNYKIDYARYDGSTWSTTATVIPGQPAQDDSAPQIAFDHNGNALAVWYQYDGSKNQIYYARYNGSTWSTQATIIPGQPAQNGFAPQIAFDHNGNALAVWTQYNGGKYQIYYARYESLTPPTITSAQQKIHCFPTQADYINYLAWNPIIGVATLAGYNIYCKPYGSATAYSFIGNVAKSAPAFFCHHNRNPRQRLVYTITSVDGDGNESAPTSPAIIPDL